MKNEIFNQTPPSQEQLPLPLLVSPSSRGLMLRQQHMRPSSNMKPDAEAKACAQFI